VDYTVEKGSTKVTLLPAGIARLQASNEGISTTLKAVFSDGYVVLTTILIKDTSLPKPVTQPGGVTDKTPDTGANSDTGSDDRPLVSIKTAGGSTVTAKAGDKISTIPAPTKKGYAFNGWFTAKKGGKQLSPSAVVKADSKIYAQWTAQKYTVKYNANKGKVKVKSKKVTYASKYGKLTKPTRSNYTFKGWYTKKSGGTKITASSKVKITKTTTLYAHWKRK
jgi:uncharacterized repeat protein (TIGR02543 family)